MDGNDGDFTLNADILARVDMWREAQSGKLTRAEAVDDLIRIGLRGVMPGVSQGEKLILSMLCDLNRKSEAKGMIDPDFIEQAIQGGHLWAIEWQHPSLAHRHINSEVHADFVVETLTMWRMIEESFRKLSNDDKADVMEGAGLSAEPTFPGWDADSEANYKSIARFMVERIRLFPTFRSRASRASGGAVVRRYRQMLRHFTAWGKDVTDRDLSKSELVELLEIFGSGAGGAAAQSPVVSQGD